MLMPALCPRPNLAHLQMYNFYGRPKAFAQSVAVIAHKRRIGARNQEHAVDPVGLQLGRPFRQRRVTERGDCVRMISPSLESRIEAPPAWTQQLRQSILGKAEVQPQPGLGLRRSLAPALVDLSIPLLCCSGACHSADDVLL